MTTETPDPYRTPAEVGEATAAPRSMKPILLAAGIAGTIAFAIAVLFLALAPVKQVEEFGEERREVVDWDEYESAMETVSSEAGPSSPSPAPSP